MSPSFATSGGAANRSMLILEIETFGRGGLTHYTYNLAGALADRGHEVTLLTTAAYELDGRSLPPNLSVVKAIARLPSGRPSSLPPRLLRLARRAEAVLDAVSVAAFARRLRPDVIHFHSTNSSAVASFRISHGPSTRPCPSQASSPPCSCSSYWM